MKPKYSNLRRDTAELMKCDCGAERYITRSGVICSAGCPGLTLMGCDLADFRKAWPERAMEYEGDEQTGETKDCPSCNGTGAQASLRIPER